MSKIRFDCDYAGRGGRVRGVRELPYAYLLRHVAGDWGEIGPDDAIENDVSRFSNRARSLETTRRSEQGGAAFTH
jgi:hypothetical protein